MRSTTCRSASRCCCAFTAFNQRTTPELNGEVSHVSADVAGPEDRGELLHGPHRRAGGGDRPPGRLKLVAGMPVEAFIQTGERTVMSYLVKPLSDQLMHAWRER